jgi:NitT/TauT family transport system substrate-binding protein
MPADAEEPTHMKAPFKRLLVASLTVVALSTVVACTDSGNTGSANTLTVGFVVDPSWAQIAVADEGGLFGKHNVNVKVVNFSSGIEALQAVAAGQVDVGTAADVPVAAVLTRSPSLRVVADGSRWEGSRIIARRSAGITDVKDLAGKSIGTPLGTSAAYFVASALSQSGIDARLVQVAPSATVTAATQHNVDAVSIFQPYQAQVVQALGPDAVELNGGTYSQHSLYLASQTAVSNKATALSAFFEALAGAGAQLASRTDSAVNAVATATQLNPGLLREVLPQFNFTLQLQPALASNLTALGNWAKTQGSIDRATILPDYATFLDGQFMPKS